MLSWLKDLLLDSNDRYLKSLNPIIREINALEEEFSALKPSDWPIKTAEFKAEIAAGASLDQILPRAFALVRAVAKSVLGQRHYDVQLLGGIVLSRGQIAEMGTGEGKTLTSTLPIYLQALLGKGVHVVTANDYLARRDAAWMGRVFSALGLTLSVIQEGASFKFQPVSEPDSDSKVQAASVEVDREWLQPCRRQEAYLADITYGTNSEFGFDYLRDNMAVEAKQLVQRPLQFAIIDEADSILIDEARTPLIISGSSRDAADKYYQFADLVRKLKPNEHYTVDEKHRQVTLTDEGIAKVESLLGLPNFYAPENIGQIHHLENALRAEALFKLDTHYVVQNGEVKIVDEFTGRIMVGRRYSEGLHQAIEAKENVAIQQESTTLATVTIQNYFRQYQKIAGMTGTALTEAEEFAKIYNLEVVGIPPHRKSQRLDLPDAVYTTFEAKLNAVANTIKEAFEQGQPVLVGTISIAKSEELSALLSRRGIPHQVLNAKNHEQEGAIIAQAGRLKAVTIATNMAGRGVDIILGGNPPTEVDANKVRELGGLFVIGTERHESRRVDNQLRGRSGRQGDPGKTKFFLSLEDDLMRIFGSNRVQEMMKNLGLPPDVPVENKLVTRTISSAQKKVEGYHFDTRKHLLEYDNVLNKQREVIYQKRREALMAERVKTHSEFSSLGQKIIKLIGEYIQAAKTNFQAGILSAEDVLAELKLIKAIAPEKAEKIFSLQANIKKQATEIDDWFESLRQNWEQAYLEQQIKAETAIPEYGFIILERMMWLQTIDQFWIEHMQAMDQLKAGIGLRGYAQREPLVEYQHESYRLFKTLLNSINEQLVQLAFTLTPTQNNPVAVNSVYDQPLILNDPSQNLVNQDIPMAIKKPNNFVPAAHQLPSQNLGLKLNQKTSRIGNRAERRKRR